MEAIQYEPKTCDKRLRGLRIDPITVPVTAAGVVVNSHARVLAVQRSGQDEVPALLVRHPDYRRIQSGDC